jgi:hypothetical protein
MDAARRARYLAASARNAPPRPWISTDLPGYAPVVDAFINVPRLKEPSDCAVLEDVPKTSVALAIFEQQITVPELCGIRWNPEVERGGSARVRIA